MEQRVSLVTLGVGDLAQSVAFYRALGWEPREDEHGWPLRDDGSVQLG